MSIAYNTGAVSRGLVFAYDMHNTRKSWKGKPTTNILTVDMTTWSKDNGCTVTLLNETYQGQPIYRVYFPSGTLPRTHFTFPYTATTFSGSVYYRKVEVGTTLPSMYFRETGFGATYSSANTYNGSVGEWVGIDMTHTFNNSSSCMFLLYVSSSTTTEPSTVDFCMPQVEENSFATPYVNGTRSITDAFIDMTGNYTQTVVSEPIYNSDNTVTFDNSSRIGVTTDMIYGTDTTWDSWIRCDSYISTYNMYMGRHLPYFSCKNDGNWFVSNIIGGTQRNTAFNIPGGANLSVWYNIAVTTKFNGSDTLTSVYVNGKLTNTSTYTGSQGNYDGTYYWAIGDGKTTNWYPFNGRVDTVKIYNRELPGNEIERNFNALRGRYGI